MFFFVGGNDNIKEGIVRSCSSVMRKRYNVLRNEYGRCVF